MEHGQYIQDRWMVGIITSICQQEGISWTALSDDWVLELSKDGVTSKIFGYKFSLNDAASTAIAGDKVAMFQLLRQHDVPAVEHRLIRSKVSYTSNWQQGLGRVVIKPLDGTSGHAVKLLNSTEDVQDYIDEHTSIAAWAISPYVEILKERRYVILDGTVLASYEKLPVVMDGLKMFNLGLGATAVPIEGSDTAAELAVQAITSAGLRVASVDMVLISNEWKVLEINDGIMMENFMRQDYKNIVVATGVYKSIITASLKAKP